MMTRDPVTSAPKGANARTDLLAGQNPNLTQQESERVSRAPRRETASSLPMVHRFEEKSDRFCQVRLGVFHRRALAGARFESHWVCRAYPGHIANSENKSPVFGGRPNATMEDFARKGGEPLVPSSHRCSIIFPGPLDTLGLVKVRDAIRLIEQDGWAEVRHPPKSAKSLPPIIHNFPGSVRNHKKFEACGVYPQPFP